MPRSFAKSIAIPTMTGTGCSFSNGRYQLLRASSAAESDRASFPHPVLPDFLPASFGTVIDPALVGIGDTVADLAEQAQTKPEPRASHATPGSSVVQVFPERAAANQLHSEKVLALRCDLTRRSPRWRGA